MSKRKIHLTEKEWKAQLEDAYQGGRVFERMLTASWLRGQTNLWAADTIERGEHLRGGE